MASKLHNRFKTDESKEEQGVWIDFGEGIRVRVRRIRSRFSQAVRLELEKPHSESIRRGPLPNDVAEDLMMKQIAKALISEWEGVTDEDGNVLECTYENKLAIIKELPELRDEILQVSMDRDSYKAAKNEESLKNS